MDTQEAIQTLQALQIGIRSQITGLQSQSDSLDVGIKQLQGILSLQLAELETAKQTIDELKANEAIT